MSREEFDQLFEALQQSPHKIDDEDFEEKDFDCFKKYNEETYDLQEALIWYFKSRKVFSIEIWILVGILSSPFKEV